MSVADLRSTPSDAELTTDVCIIGSGPAGTTIARELAGRRSVILLESGGLESSDADDLNTIRSVGAPRVMDQRLVRNRVLGGSSSTWWGRSAVFDDVDFAERPWVAYSGWPIGRAELEPYFARAARALGLGVDDNTLDAELLSRNPLPFAPDRLLDYRWTYSRAEDDPEQPVRFGASAAALRGVDVLLHATVVEVVAASDGTRVSSLRVRALDGTMRTIVARRVVLAAGGIENARILLTSDSVQRHGLGNEHDQVGRFLMDHLRGPVGSYAPEHFAAAQRAFGAFRTRTRRGTVRVTPGAALAMPVQRAEHLLQAAVWIEGPIDEDDAVIAARRLLRDRRPVDALTLARGAPLAAESIIRSRLLGRSSLRARSALHLHCIVEQAPDPRSRVLLGEERDAAGVRRSVIDWRFGEQEARTVRRLAAIFTDECARLGIPSPVLDPMIRDDDAPFLLPDVAHPTGTTRMSRRPEDGVVDASCRVHGIDNLWVAGSSVFPTSGHANPTQTLLALAIRLSDQLVSA